MNIRPLYDRIVVKRVETQDEKTAGGLIIPDSAKEKPQEGSAASPLGSGSVERIVAVGNPVVLDAPSQSAYTEAERLEYNLKTRQVLLKSFKAGAKRHLKIATWHRLNQRSCRN